MIEAVMCFGSNLAAAEAIEKIMHAKVLLQEGDCRFVKCTDIYPSSSGYYNMVTIVEVDHDDFDALNARCKQIERGLGRKPEMKALGIVPIDIDIVVYGGKVVRQLDFDSVYFKKGYKTLLKNKQSGAKDQGKTNDVEKIE